MRSLQSKEIEKNLIALHVVILLCTLAGAWLAVEWFASHALTQSKKKENRVQNQTAKLNHSTKTRWYQSIFRPLALSQFAAWKMIVQGQRFHTTNSCKATLKHTSFRHPPALLNAEKQFKSLSLKSTWSNAQMDCTAARISILVTLLFPRDCKEMTRLKSLSKNS